MRNRKIRDWINKSRFWKLEKGTKIKFVVGITLVSILVLTAIFANLVAPFKPDKIDTNVLLKPPGEDHLLGTDTLGRDIYSRCLFGMRISLFIGLGATLFASTLGSTLGIISGYKGGIYDKALTLPMDALWALPGFINALLVVVILGPSILNTAIAIGIGWIPNYYRTVRSLTISLREEDFVKAEITMGASDMYIIFRHLLPLCFSVIIVLTTMGIARSIISAAGLGFLGLGVPAPIPELGADLAQARQVLPRGAWWAVTAPSLFIFLLILGFNLFGESLNKLLGTTLKEV